MKNELDLLKTTFYKLHLAERDAQMKEYLAGHGGTYRQPHGGEFRIPAIAWLDWQLKGSKEAFEDYSNSQKHGRDGANARYGSNG